MKALGEANLFLFVTFLALTTADQGGCPPWFFPDLDNGTRCVVYTQAKSRVAEAVPC